MSLETELQATESLTARREQVRARADAYLSRGKLLEGDSSRLTLDDVRASLALAHQLQEGALEVLLELREVGEPTADAARMLALSDGLTWLDGVQDDLRKRLSALESSPQTVAGSGSLELVLSRPGQQEAVQATLFAAFWNIFTLLHGGLMIGVFALTMGLVALLLLPFYALFLAVGVGLIKSAIEARTLEVLRLDGEVLTITKTRNGLVRTQEITLAPNSRFTVVRQATQVKNQAPRYELSVRDVNGKEHRFGSRIPAQERDAVCKRLNAAL